MFRTTGIVIAGLLMWFLSVIFHHTIETASPEESQKPSSWISLRTDPVWSRVCRWLVSDITRIRGEFYQQLASEKDSLQHTEQLTLIDPSETASEGRYGTLPQIFVDLGHGAVFPTPIERPNRFSWFQTVTIAFRIHRHLRSLQKVFSKNRSMDTSTRKRTFEAAVNRWHQINSEYVDLMQKFRYLDTWIPWLQERPSYGQKGIEALFNIASSAKTLPEAELERLRQELKPRRIMIRPFLPFVLKSGEIPLPITTDIHNQKFLREIEGALNTHWNQSPWAKNQKIRFKIYWRIVPENPKFRSAKINLAQHLFEFPKDSATLTTGSATTHVSHEALILGAGRITPRTLAHELGHLLGFGDCYIRTLSGQGLFGLAILEWDNPFYPDDLMCDNTLGVARVESW
ncbi:MAG: hypothetical protein HYX41_02790 [Bdellovibrio sp.]|nr:hypothetical protein [Bdellovibrio sp.]